MNTKKQKGMNTFQKIVVLPLTAGILAFGGVLKAEQPRIMPKPKTQVVEVMQISPDKALKQDLSSLQQQVDNFDANRAQDTLRRIRKDLNLMESSKIHQGNRPEIIRDMAEVHRTAKAAIESLKTEQRMQNTFNANQEGIAKERLTVGIRSEALDSAINKADVALSNDSYSDATIITLSGMALFGIAAFTFLDYDHKRNLKANAYKD